MEGQHEFSEVDGAAVVCVEGSEDVLTEVVSIATWEYLGVHLYKLFLGQLSRRTVLQESLIPALPTSQSILLHLAGLSTCIEAWSS